MNSFFRPNSTDIRTLSLLYIVSGLILIFLNNEILYTVARFFGILLIVVAVFFFYRYFALRVTSDPTPLFIGIPLILLGSWLVFFPESWIAWLPILTGIAIILNGFMQIQNALRLKDLEFPNWKKAMIFSIVCIGIGILLFTKPLQSLAFILKILGILLIIQGISIWYNDRTLRKLQKQFEENF